MKIVLSRDEIKALVKERYGFKADDFILEISQENAFKLREPASPEPVSKEPDVEYDITVDKNGFITDMVPKTQNPSTVPFKDHLGRTWNYENKCVVCGRTFFSMTQPCRTCSKDCMDKDRKAQKEASRASSQLSDAASSNNDIDTNEHNYYCTCVQCGKQFKGKGPRSAYCSNECRKLFKSSGKRISDLKSPKNSNKHKSSKHNIPKNPKIDYSVYAIEIEDFLNSTETSKQLSPVEGLTIAGTRDRYATAAKIFDLKHKIKLNCSESRKALIMSKA